MKCYQWLLLVLAVLIGWHGLAEAESTGVPAELPIREIRSVDREWGPYACDISEPNA